MIRTDDSPAPTQRLTRFLVLTVVTLAYTAVVLHHSLRYHRLAYYPTYDDIGYLRDAMFRVKDFYDGGVRALWAGYFERIPHSPFSTAAAFLGFTLFGPHDWAPYAVNGLVVLGLLYFVCWLLRHTPWWARTLAVAMVLTVPLTGNAIREFRPDVPNGLLTAFGVILLVTTPVAVEPRDPRHRRRLIVAGLFFAGALLTKPPAFANTLALAVGSFGLAAIADFLTDRGSFRLGAALRAAVISLGAMVLVALPHYLVHGKAIWWYFYTNYLGDQKEVWVSHLSVKGHLLFYITGVGGRFMLGNYLWFLLAVIAAGVVAVVVESRRERILRVIALGVATLAAFAIPNTSPVKQEFFGVIFQSLLLLGAVMSLGFLCRAAADRAAAVHWRIPAAACAVSAVVVAVALFRWPEPLATPGEVAQRRQVVDQVFAALKANNHEPRARVFFTVAGHVTGSLFEYLSLRDSMVPIDCPDNPFSDNLKQFSNEFDAADFVIAAEPGNPMVPPSLKSSLVADKTLDMLRARPDYKPLAEIPTQNGKRYFLFAHKHTFHGWDRQEGLLDPEGPYPEQDLPMIRVGLGPLTKLFVVRSGGGPWQLDLSSRPVLPDSMQVIVKLNGQFIAKQVENDPHHWYDLKVPLTLRPGNNRIDIVYTKFDKSDPRVPRAVIFRELRLHPQPRPE